jgi:hypothetical protein
VTAATPMTDEAYDAWFSDEYMMSDPGPGVRDRVLGRLRRLLDEDTGVRLPPGMRVVEFHDTSFEVTVDPWVVPYLTDDPREARAEVSACGWPTDWSGELWAAAADPAVSDRVVARLLVAEIAAAAAAALMHETVEWASFDNRPLWDPHGGDGGFTSGGAHVTSVHGQRTFLSHVELCGRPPEID